jgi:Na+-driven multidrug efflux pump
MLSQISRISVPSILQSSFVSVGNLFIQSLVNFYGAMELGVIGGYSAAIKLNTFALTCFTTISNSISGYSAQNVGAGRFDRVKTGIKSGGFMSFIVAIPFAITFFFLGGELTSIFATESGEGIIRTGRVFLQIVSPFYLLIGFKIVIDGAMRGLGIMKPFIIATCVDLILRVFFAYVLSPVFGSDGIWMSWPVGWMIALLIDVAFYYYYIVKEKAVRKTEDE